MHKRADRAGRPTGTGHDGGRRRGPALVVGAAATGAVALLAACGSPASGNASAGHLAAKAQPAPTTTAPPPLQLVGETPASGTPLASGTTPLALTFSSPLAAVGADPQVSPATPGTWAQQGATLTFTPTSGYQPFEPLTVTVPAGLAGTDRAMLAAPVTLHWVTPTPSTLRIQELLAATGYLPLSFTPAPATAAPTTAPTSTAPTSTPPTSTPATSTTAPSAGAPATTLAASDIPTADQPGTFTWRWGNVPAGLAAQWSQGQPDLVTKGAIMAFEADHGLAVDGLAGPQVWGALTAAVAAGQTDPRPYDYISVSMARPETLTVWQAGAVVYTSTANTGVPGAQTAPGTFPVYERFTVTTMRGTNPDGSKYVDPGIPWVAYFNGGDAIHGFVRASYGFPQSDGCVELPPANAQAVYPMDYYGTLVTVA